MNLLLTLFSPAPPCAQRPNSYIQRTANTRSLQGLDGTEFESRFEQEIFVFPKMPRPVLGHTKPPVQGVPGLIYGVNAAGE